MTSESKDSGQSDSLGSNSVTDGDPAGGSLSENNPPALAAQGGREINKRVLYVGGIDQNVTEDMLIELFKVTGNVTSIKILQDKNKRGFNYAFVEYEDQSGADLALHTLNGRILNQSEIRINWAYQTQQAIKDEENFNIFVGDLSSEVNDDILSKAFSSFGSMVEARVMWDMSTGRSRGYGFVSFKQRQDAEQALQTMDGEWIGNRQIRCNWASQKQQGFGGHGGGVSFSGSGVGLPIGVHPGQPVRHQPRAGHPHGHGIPINMAMPMNMAIPPPQSYEIIVNQTPNWQTTVYIGNLAPFTSTSDLIPIVQNFGYIVDLKHQPDRGYAFVKYDSHERAAMAIVQLSGYQINGRLLKCGWGKDRQPVNQFNFRSNYPGR